MKANKFQKENTRNIELTGKVVRKKFAAGSKSEHDAVCLETSGGTYKLRRINGNPFSDPKLDKLVGKKVTATATNILNKELFFADENAIKILDKD